MSRVKWFILIIAAAGIIFGVIGIGDTIKIMKEDFVDLGTVKKDELQVGDLAKGPISGAYDEIAVEKTTRTYGFIPMGSSETPYYLVNVGDHFAVLSVGNKDIQKQIEAMANQTWDYYDGKTETAPTPIELTTKVNAMPDKVKQFLNEYCTEWGMTAEQYAQVVDDSCVINYVKYDTMKLIPFIGIGVGVLFLIIFIIILVKGKGKTVYVNEQPPMYPPQDPPMNGGLQ